MNNIKVLHAPTSVGSNPQGMSKALNRINVNSTDFTLYPHPFEYMSDFVLFKKEPNFIVREIVKIFYFLKLYRTHDIIHFNFGTTISSSFSPVEYEGDFFRTLLSKIKSKISQLIESLELLYLGLLKRKYCITYQGSDARQGDYCQGAFNINYFDKCPSLTNSWLDEFKRKKIKKLTKKAAVVYSVNPDLLHVLPKNSKYIPYSHVFMDEFKPVYNLEKNNKLKICHAPSHRGIKGTDVVLSVLEELQRDGYEIDIILVEGLPYKKAIEEYKKCDIFIDQLYAGWYGGVAVELMALGKPVFCYIRRDDLVYLPSKMVEDLPIINVTESSLRAELVRIISMNRSSLQKIAENSRAYVEKWHNPIEIAKSIKQDYIEALSK